MIVNVKVANRRPGASTKYKVLGVARKGAKLQVVSKSGSWYKVKYGKGTGFIAGWLVRKG
ncbi:MAG: SH3 domain-containing protein [Syntrophomonas sp.]